MASARGLRRRRGNAAEPYPKMSQTTKKNTAKMMNKTQ
jgi:hypothetical protein